MHLTIPARKLDNLRAMVIHAPDMVDVEAANGVRRRDSWRQGGGASLWLLWLPSDCSIR